MSVTIQGKQEVETILCHAIGILIPLFVFPPSHASGGENLRPRTYKMQELICIHGSFPPCPARHNAGPCAHQPRLILKLQETEYPAKYVIMPLNIDIHSRPSFQHIIHRVNEREITCKWIVLVMLTYTRTYCKINMRRWLINRQTLFCASHVGRMVRCSC